MASELNGRKMDSFDIAVARRDPTNSVVSVMKGEHKDAFTTLLQDPSEYLTTNQVAKLTGTYEGTINRWCHKWFGDLPPGRVGRSLGYRIPHDFAPVACGWAQTKDQDIREAMLRILPGHLHPIWFVSVGKVGAAYEDLEEAMLEANKVLRVQKKKTKTRKAVNIFYVGKAVDSTRRQQEAIEANRGNR